MSSIETMELVKLAGHNSKNTCRNTNFFTKHSSYELTLEFIQK